MGQRLTSIVTRTGDQGETGLANQTRVPKNHLRVECMGELDELNSFLGLLRCESLAQAVSYTHLTLPTIYSV